MMVAGVAFRCSQCVVAGLRRRQLGGFVDLSSRHRAQAPLSD